MGLTTIHKITTLHSGLISLLAVTSVLALKILPLEFNGNIRSSHVSHPK